METNDFQKIIEIAQQKSLSKAAESLGVTQPTLSKMLSRVESEIGHKLFYRFPRRLELTPEGQIFVNAFKTILETLKSSHGEVEALKNDFSDEISIGLHMLMGHRVIPEIETAIESLPGIRVQYKIKSSREVLREVVAGDLSNSLTSLQTIKNRL